jgi:tetratricopeptide (TPR) repeat protein
MNRIGPSVRDTVARTDAYLRVIPGSLKTESLRISVELGAPRNTVNVRSYLDDYSVVLGRATTPRVDEIRHAYLHVRLNNYAAAASFKAKGRTELTALLKNAEGAEPQYKSNFENMFTESLIRAVELRIDRVPAATAETTVKSHYRSGLLLLPYFYESMPAYEASDNILRDEVVTLAAGIDVGKEQERFQKTFYSIPIPEKQVVRAETPVETAPAPDPVLELLRTASAAFEKDKPRAREVFERVLKEHNPNEGRALYGIALIEMDSQNLDEALQYFERTIASDTADRSMKTWSYIYAGHILDFKCNRAAALEKYRKAIETGDDTRDAQKIAKRDLAQPFGGECQQ